MSDRVGVDALLREALRPIVAELVAEEVEERLRDLDAERREPELLTVAEAAERIRAKPQRVYDLLSDGRLTRHKDGSRVLVSRRELNAHVRAGRGDRG